MSLHLWFPCRLFLVSCRYLLLRSFRSIFWPLLFSSFNARRVQYAADDVITHAREIFHAAATDHHDGVFLQTVLLARDVRCNFHAVRKAHPRYFAQCGVRLLRSRRENLQTYAAFERRSGINRAVMNRIHVIRQSRRLGLRFQGLPASLY